MSAKTSVPRSWPGRFRVDGVSAEAPNPPSVLPLARDPRRQLATVVVYRDRGGHGIAVSEPVDELLKVLEHERLALLRTLVTDMSQSRQQVLEHHGDEAITGDVHEDAVELALNLGEIPP